MQPTATADRRAWPAAHQHAGCSRDAPGVRTSGQRYGFPAVSKQTCMGHRRMLLCCLFLHVASYLVQGDGRLLEQLDVARDLQGRRASCIQHSNHLVGPAGVAQHLFHRPIHLQSVRMSYSHLCTSGRSADPRQDPAAGVQDARGDSIVEQAHDAAASATAQSSGQHMCERRLPGDVRQEPSRQQFSAAKLKTLHCSCFNDPPGREGQQTPCSLQPVHDSSQASLGSRSRDQDACV